MMSPQRGVLPTLTEVIEIHPDALPEPIGPEPLPPESMPMEQADEFATPRSSVRAEPPLAERVGELLAPEMALLVERTIDSVRAELSLAVQTLVHRAIDDALAERRRR